jgi:hypothetical protein
MGSSLKIWALRCLFSYLCSYNLVGSVTSIASISMNPTNVILTVYSICFAGAQCLEANDTWVCYDHGLWQMLHALLKRVKLTTVARVYHRGVPPVNPAALTAMIDRWRPETHNFHLLCGEMTITLEDATMILRLKIRGFPGIGDTKSVGWEDRVAQFLGHPLPDLQPGKKQRSSGVPLKWLREQFH